jgi:mono/diheme cytochrome c family protein
MYGFTYSSVPADPDGKQVFIDGKCTTCHTVVTAGVTSKKKDATDLSKTGDTHKADFLAKYLTKKDKLNGKDHKTAFKGTEQELNALTKWLESLKSKK